jgi:hypothetical protein
VSLNWLLTAALVHQITLPKFKGTVLDAADATLRSPTTGMLLDQTLVPMSSVIDELKRLYHL